MSKAVYFSPRIYELRRIAEIRNDLDTSIAPQLAPDLSYQIKTKPSFWSKTSTIQTYLNSLNTSCIKEVEEKSKVFLQLSY